MSLFPHAPVLYLILLELVVPCSSPSLHVMFSALLPTLPSPPSYPSIHAIYIKLPCGALPPISTGWLARTHLVTLSLNPLIFPSLSFPSHPSSMNRFPLHRTQPINLVSYITPSLSVPHYHFQNRNDVMWRCCLPSAQLSTTRHDAGRGIEDCPRAVL